MKIFIKDGLGWVIGTYKSPILIRWTKFTIVRYYGVIFNERSNTICFGRLEIRIRKPKFLRSGHGIYLRRLSPYDRGERK